MIDIHPPHKSDHTWKDFFIHIGTIAVGILIAIGLEQTVELIHQHHQRTELREGAITDARIYLRDVDQNGTPIPSRSKISRLAYGRFGRQSRSITCWLRQRISRVPYRDNPARKPGRSHIQRPHSFAQQG